MYFDDRALRKCNFVVKAFYGKNSINFKNITNEKIELLKQKSLHFNNFFNQNKGSKLAVKVQKALQTLPSLKYIFTYDKFTIAVHDLFD